MATHLSTPVVMVLLVLLVLLLMPLSLIARDLLTQAGKGCCLLCC